MNTAFDFSPGDIIEHGGECYQVLEDHGTSGLVRNFPSDEETGFELAWESEGVLARRIGQAPLPAPSPCSTGGSCPTYTIEPKPKAPLDRNIIARQA